MTEIVILSLVCWRLSSLLTNEDGPYDLFIKLRKIASNVPWSPLGCLWCTSIWVGFCMAFIYGLPILYFPAISAGAIMINKWIEA